MSKKQFKSQASSGRAAFGGGGAFGGGFGTSSFGSSSPLSWIAEPPDLSGISDPNVAVSFKNLSKKDSTTKAKALEDLQVYVTSPENQVEEAVLEAWVKLYPRLSIDAARRVRQLAHTVLGNIAAKCGKRIAKHMPRLAGPWLSGAQDSDRAAASAAQNALKQVFNTPEKLQNVGKAFHAQILEYCRDAVLNETVQTLSDERAVSSDDAEATYARVIATCLAVVSNLIAELPESELAKQQDTYESIMDNTKVWELSAYKDVAVRRSTHRLLRASLTKQRSIVEVHLDIVSQSYIGKALPADQTASALDLLQALVELTVAFPRAWTTSYKGKKAASQRLRQGVKKGSQSGTAAYWTVLWTLFSGLPKEALPKGFAEAKEMLSALHSGIVQKEERFNSTEAWDTYFKVANLLVEDALTVDEEKGNLVKDMVLPVIEQYLRPSSQTSDWAISGAKPAFSVSKAAYCQRLSATLEQKWVEWVEQLVQDMKLSQPEKSKDFDRSQSSIAQSGERWALLQLEFFRGGYTLSPSLKQSFAKSAETLASESLELLKNRNGKPYGAAAVVDALLTHAGKAMMSIPAIHDLFATFILEELPNLLYSPSQRQLLSLLYHFQEDPQFTEAWAKAADALTNSPDSSEKTAAFRLLLTSSKTTSVAELASKNQDIQAFLERQLKSSITSGDDWAFLTDILKLTPSVASPQTVESILADLTLALTISESSASAIGGLEQISLANKSLVKEYIAQPSGSQLLPNILLLEESPDPHISAKASKIAKRIVDATDKTASQAILFDVVHQSLRDVSENTLPIESLLEKATKLISDSDIGNNGSEVAKQAAPSFEAWEASLSLFLDTTIPGSQAITSFLGGAVFLTQPSATSAPRKIGRDLEGLSQTMRLAMYASRIFSQHGDLLKMMDSASKIQLFRLFYLTLILVNDGVALYGPFGLVADPTPELESDVRRFANEANRLVSRWFQEYDAGNSDYAFIGAALDQFWDALESSSPAAMRNAEALALALADIEASHGPSHPEVQKWEQDVVELYKQRATLRFVTLASGLRESLAGSKKLVRQTNELVADLTGLDISSSSTKALEQLVMLNALLPDTDVVAVVAKQRVVFLMKHVLHWLEGDDASPEVRVEVFKSLCTILPGVGDLYGEHWSGILTSITGAWTAGFVSPERQSLDHSSMVIVHNSLRLMNVLRKLMISEDPNDDLIDAWKEHEDAAYVALVQLVKQGQGVPDEDYGPLKTTFDLLAQEVARFSKVKVDDAAELFPVLYTDSRALQRTAFNILHAYIPGQQEQISFDVALENKTAQLPEELLSLILEAPSPDVLADGVPRSGLPKDLQGYLYSWQLVFDHFTNASYKVKSDYIESLKEGDYLPGLLLLLYELLGHNRGRPVDVSKYDITRYDWTEQEDELTDVSLTPQQRLHWLLAHLFYNSLAHLPSLTKSHFLSLTSRQTSLAVESWVAKTISPLIIHASLSAVADWAATSAKSDPDSDANLTVKVGLRAREVSASYLVDEQTMAIAIRLPDTYPLAGARVDGLSRVAVDEKRWQSWLRNCQGVITFSNGNLIDGLSAWRKNVVGALKGQTECAICYSVISADRQLPSKRCGTCRNLFHSSCLFKWFKTSNASTCPLCRNSFNYA